MSAEKTVRQIADEWNARAKAEGVLLDHELPSAPPAVGSLLDVPDTPESRARAAWLAEQIAELQRRDVAPDADDGPKDSREVERPTTA